MKRLFLVLVLVGAGVVGLGFYLGWFHVEADSGGGKSAVTLSVDRDKIQEDRNTTAASVQEVGRHLHINAGAPTETTMDGTVVRIEGDKLTMATKEGKEHSHSLAANLKVTCDGKTCTATDLKPGMRIRVTPDTKDRYAAARIEALDRDPAFASSSHDGQVVSITRDKLVMTNTNGSEEHTHTLKAELRVTCDGSDCKVADLKPGMRVRVTTKIGEPYAATRIEALDNKRDFQKGD